MAKIAADREFNHETTAAALMQSMASHQSPSIDRGHEKIYQILLHDRRMGSCAVTFNLSQWINDKSSPNYGSILKETYRTIQYTVNIS